MSGGPSKSLLGPPERHRGVGPQEGAMEGPRRGPALRVYLPSGPDRKLPQNPTRIGLELTRRNYGGAVALNSSGLRSAKSVPLIIGGKLNFTACLPHLFHG